MRQQAGGKFTRIMISSSGRCHRHESWYHYSRDLFQINDSTNEMRRKRLFFIRVYRLQRLFHLNSMSTRQFLSPLMLMFAERQLKISFSLETKILGTEL